MDLANTMPDKPLELTPEQRIKELEQKLADVQQKADFFEAVVDVLKRDHGIRVVKKPRGKSSKSDRSSG